MVLESVANARSWWPGQVGRSQARMTLWVESSWVSGSNVVGHTAGTWQLPWGPRVSDPLQPSPHQPAAGNTSSDNVTCSSFPSSPDYK